MDEDELQARILIALFRIRTSNGGWMTLDDIAVSGGAPVTLGQIAASARYLADKELIKFSPAGPGNVGVAGRGQIAASGVDYVKSRSSREYPTLEEMLRPRLDVSAEGQVGLGAPPPPQSQGGQLSLEAGIFAATEPRGRLTGVEMKAEAGSFVPKPPPLPPMGWYNPDDGSAIRIIEENRRRNNAAQLNFSVTLPHPPDAFLPGKAVGEPLNPDGRNISGSINAEGAKVDPTATHQEILRRIEAIERALANAPPISPGIGHNNPPEPILTAEDVSNLREVFRALRDMPATPVPSPADVKPWEETLEQSSQKILAYLAKLGDKFVSGATTQVGTIAITVLLGGVGLTATAWAAISFYNDLAEELTDLANLLQIWSGVLH